MIFGSMSSRSFREMVLVQSIASIFKKGVNQPAATSEPRSESSTDLQHTTGEGKSADVEDKDCGIAPATTNDTSLSRNEGEVASYNGKIDPFAGGVEGGVDYKSMKWWQAGMVMVAETISLGILALPKALSDLGFVPGLILLIAMGIMASYSGYIIGRFRMMYPHVHSYADAGEVLFGRVGREVLGAGQLLFYIFIMGSHILTFAVMMNVITDHGTCTIVFMVAGMILSLIFTLPRTCTNLSYYSIVSFISIIAAVLITMIGVSISRPSFHADSVTGLTAHDIRLWPRTDISFHEAFLAVANMVFAYAGHVAFFTFISELKEPNEFPKALAFLQVSDISMYIVTAVVVYYYAGNNVTSPAIDSASPLIRKIAYGVAIPTIVIAGVVNGHVGVKYIYVRLLRNDENDTMHKKSFKAIGLWVALCAVLWFVAWAIAEGIPVFNDLLGVTSALFASWFTFGLSGMFWFHMNFQWASKNADVTENDARIRDDEAVAKTWKPVYIGTWNWKRTFAFAANVLNILVGAAICVIGLYASGKSISLNSTSTKPFSCADNSPH